MSFRVLIPTAGTGSRLGKLTRFLNKSLVSVSNKPVISHIIEKYPADCEFVIPLGYKGNLVKDFLNLAYPERKFIFEEINPYDGIGSGLGFTIICCKKYLQEPFIFHSCDTLIKEVIPSPTYNWMGYDYIKNKLFSSYRTIIIERNKVLSICEKGEKSRKNMFPYIGLCSIFNFSDFWQNMSKDSNEAINTGEVFGLYNLLPNIKAKLFTWNDTGQKENLAIAREEYKIKDSPNILEKEDEAIWFTTSKKVIKFSNNNDFIKNRIYRAKALEKFVPKLKGTTNSMYSYDLIEGEVISKSINLITFKNLLCLCKKFWEEYHLDVSEKNNFILNCEEFYKNKTFHRISEYYDKFGMFDRENILNGEKVPKLESILLELNWKNISNGIAGRFHGDFHFENIIIDKKNNSFKFIDWRQDFAGDLLVGDIYYDLSKLLHGIIVNHSIIKKGLFSIRQDKENYCINFDFHRKNSLIECEHYYYEWLKSEGYDVKKVRILTGIIYLNISALHHYPYSNFLYYLGKKILYDEIIKNK